MMVNLYHQASKQMPDVVSLPPKWLNMYGDFITKNASAVSQIESALRSLTYIIPGQLNEIGAHARLAKNSQRAGRFRESELASESCESE